MKKIFLFMVFLLWGIAAFARTHTVARGESLENIAAKYNISQAQLIEANPGAANLFYVGLVLNIPEVTSSTSSELPTSNVELQPKESDLTNATDGATAEVKEDKPGFGGAMLIEYGFLKKPEGANGSPWAYSITAGVNYYFMHKESDLFAGARIGYNSSSNYSHSSYEGYYMTTEYSAHFITLPINVGYAFTNEKRTFGLTPLAGFDFNFCVAGKTKTEGYGHGSNYDDETKLKKKVGVDAKIGAQMRLYYFNLGVSYVIPLNKAQEMYFGEDSYVAINIGFGF